MCGRYTLVDIKSVRRRFGIEEDSAEFQASLNITPGTDQPVVIEKDTKRIIQPMRWGLVPHWAQDAKIGYRLINARAETVAEKPAFRKPIATNRCLIPANGFYEWQKQTQKKKPYYFSLEKNELMAFAGIWDMWENPTGELLSTYSILTRSADAVVAPIHDRMPLILNQDQESEWLNPLTPFETIRRVLESKNQIPLRASEITVPLQTLAIKSS